MTLDAEEMERALKIENYFLDDQNKWDLEEDKQLPLSMDSCIDQCAYRWVNQMSPANHPFSVSKM